MYVGREWDPMDVGETDIFTLDFVNDLSAGEAVLAGGPTATLAVVSGTDPSPAAHLSGGVSVSGTTASQKISGTLAGVKYRLALTVNTSLGRTLTLWSHFLSQSPD